MSLRARLIGGLLALTAAGMLLLGGITYAEQRSFLLQRVDEQASAAFGPVSHALEDSNAGVAGFEHPQPPPDHGGGGRYGPDGRGRGPGPDASRIDVPPGTYGQRRDASGRLLGRSVVLSTYGQGNPPVPRLPAYIAAGRLFTVGSAGSSGLRYRVLARATDGHAGTTIVAVPLHSVDQTLDRLRVVEALVIGGVLAMLAVLAWLLVRIGLRPLDRIGATAGAIAAGDLARRVTPATPRTEVGRLGLALNAMLERLERAFAEREASEERLRRFIADASHELRTPLASIRGYAELFRIGAAQEPVDTAKAMQRIEDEAQRMGTLVEDLLTLARLDELPDVVRQEVDVARLASDAVDDARAVDPDRSIDLRADGPSVVVGDPHQLRQVLGNLLRNALVHTPPGTAVEVAVTTPSADRAQIVVRDHGYGLPTDEDGALFERFWRAEPGRERGRAGAGLGLAIVAGIVAAHGGVVSADNAAGGGARFTVELPLNAAQRALDGGQPA